MLRTIVADARAARACPVRSQAAAIRAGMSPGARNAVVVGVEQRHVAAGGLGGEPVQLVVGGLARPAHARRHSSSSHMPITFLSSRVVPSIAALVGQVRLARGVAEHRLGQLEPEQRPRAAREDRGVLVAHRRGGEGRRGVVAGDRVDRRVAELVVGAAAGRAPCRARRASPNSRAGQPEPLDQLARPVAGARVEQPGRRGVRRLVGQLAAEPEREQVGDERDPLGGGERGRALVGQQLEDGVDRHRLDAGRRVQLGGGHALERALDHPVRARVAVVERQPEHAAALVEQRVVDAPGVDADARAAARRARRPSSASVNRCRRFQRRPSGQPHGPVGEAVDLLELDAAVVAAGRSTTRPLVAPRSIAA